MDSFRGAAAIGQPLKRKSIQGLPAASWGISWGAQSIPSSLRGDCKPSAILQDRAVKSIAADKLAQTAQRLMFD